MEQISDNFLLTQLQWRYATKRFDPKRKISQSDWNVLTEVLRLAPSSYGLQPWKFLSIKNPSLRKKLRAVSWDQSQVEDASEFVVFTSLRSVSEEYIHNYINKISQVRGVSPDSLQAYRDMMITNVAQGKQKADAQSWSQRQAYIAMGCLLQAAALKGIDACPMEGLDPKQYDEILGLEKSSYGAVAAVALGYRSEEDTYQQYKKVRFEKSDIYQEVL